ncbi:unnamed protein product [Pedinophyceae sp. YPF-701]|nr:unnamed protein product [Pedinophyceae sp. YPF-701]
MSACNLTNVPPMAACLDRMMGAALCTSRSSPCVSGHRTAGSSGCRSSPCRRRGARVRRYVCSHAQARRKRSDGPVPDDHAVANDDVWALGGALVRTTADRVFGLAFDLLAVAGRIAAERDDIVREFMSEVSERARSGRQPPAHPEIHDDHAVDARKKSRDASVIRDNDSDVETSVHRLLTGVTEARRELRSLEDRMRDG